MPWLMVLILLFALGIAVFAAQNGQSVEVHFLTTSGETTLAVVILAAAAAGAVVVALLSLVPAYSSRMEVRRLQAQLKTLQAQRDAAQPAPEESSSSS
ncbi:MAG: lipopolysaccharide assembly protein LapA domain-containing protein [Bacillota bacterium]|nr:lipopolysaccharide assembly protein LapA domain-containing protein [Bacillota bacterium]